MNLAKLTGVLLIVAGVLGLAYGSFSYTKQTEQVKLGPLALSFKNAKAISFENKYFRTDIGFDL